MLKIGCVPYLNAKPLTCGLEKARGVRLILKPPGVLVPMLRRREVDVALIPVIELFSGRPYTLMSGLGIASNGKTDSVRLYHKVGISRIRHVALDRNSRTSNALTRVILEKKHRVKPSYRMYDPARMDLSEMARSDAAVVIGDQSFRRSPLPFLDLGTEWAEWTRLPFVYAVWAARPGLDGRERIAGMLRETKDRGMRRIDGIARREAKRLRLTPQFCIQYLTRCIYYECGWKELTAILAFGSAAAKLGLCKGELNVDFC